MTNSDIKLLIVEDNPVNKKVLEKILHSNNLSAEWAQNGVEAVDACRNSTFHLVFMDLQMPEMDGIEATKLIREMGQGNDAMPIIAVTANTTTGIKEACFKAGMNDYVTKPIKKEDIDVMLQKHIPEVTIVRSRTKESEDLFNEVIDHNRINELKELDDDSLIKELITIYLSESNSGMKDIEQAIADSNAVALRHAAHKLKGGSSSIGAKIVAELSHELEKMGSEDKLSHSAEVFKKLQKAFLDAEVALTQHYL